MHAHKVCKCMFSTTSCWRCGYSSCVCTCASPLVHKLARNPHHKARCTKWYIFTGCTLCCHPHRWLQDSCSINDKAAQSGPSRVGANKVVSSGNKLDFDYCSFQSKLSLLLLLNFLRWWLCFKNLCEGFLLLLNWTNDCRTLWHIHLGTGDSLPF